MEQEKTLPRPSIEILNKFDELIAQLRDQELTDKQIDQVINRLNDILSSYDLNNYLFEDPATGKKGLKNPAGQILVPAEFDDFSFIGDHNTAAISHTAAKKDGKWGIVTTDATATILCEFRFDYLQWHPFTGLYTARWDGITDKFGFVSKTGEVVIPHVLTQLYEPVNDFLLLEDEGKFGALDTTTFSFVLPEYDSVDCAPEQDVIFVKDGIEGYVIEETGEFVPKTQFEDDEDKYGDAYVYNTYIND